MNVHNLSKNQKPEDFPKTEKNNGIEVSRLETFPGLGFEVVKLFFNFN